MTMKQLHYVKPCGCLNTFW